ncbi:MAG: HEAT repeat domain-containing protein [Bryobacteraceae bacterium]
MRPSLLIGLYLLVCVLWPLAAQQPAPSGDPKQRIHQARDLGKQGPEALAKLQAMLSDPDAEVRIEAVKSIVAIDTKDSLDPLIQATRDSDPEMQIRSTDGLVNFYLPGYVQTGLTASLRRAGNAIKSRFTETNGQTIPGYVQVRADVIAALGKLASGGASMDARANAARAIGILRGGAAIPDLVQALHSKDDDVIYESLNAIQKIRDPEAAPRISFLLHDLNEKIQIAAIETTGLLRNREALPQLRDVLEDRNSSVKVQRAALAAIAMIPDESSRPLYARFLDDRDEGLRAAAAEGFGRLKNPADLPAVQKKFEAEEKMPPRLSEAFALVDLGKTEMAQFSPLQYLIDTLNSKAWRGVASAFLIELTRDAAIRRAAEEATKTATKDERIGLAPILARSGGEDTLPYLEALSHDSDSDIAEAALDALRTLKARLP